MTGTAEARRSRPRHAARATVALRAIPDVLRAVGTVLRGVSPSPGERLVWSPFCAVTAVLARSARPVSPRGRRA